MGVGRKSVFRKRKRILGNGRTGSEFGGRQGRLSKVEAISSKGDFEQSRMGWVEAENKPPCRELANTDRFKAQFSIWLAKKKRLANANPTSKGKGETK